MTVLLTDGTVGVAFGVVVGETATLALHDENGADIEATGEVAEILEA